MDSHDPDNWYPIDTAPKDGIHILVFGRDESLDTWYWEIAHWHRDDHLYTLEPEGSDGWRDKYGELLYGPPLMWKVLSMPMDYMLGKK